MTKIKHNQTVRRKLQKKKKRCKLKRCEWCGTDSPFEWKLAYLDHMQRYALSRRCQACGYETDWLGVEIGSRIPNKPDAAVCKGRNPVWVRVPPQPLEIILARKQEALRQHNVLMERLLSVLPPRKDEDK